MRQHRTKVHKISLVPPGKHNKGDRNSVVVYENTIDGVPTCNKCGRRFDRGAALKAHAMDTCENVPAELLGSNGRSRQSACWAVSCGVSGE